MKSLMLLLQCILADASMWCCTSTTRDWKTISDRVEHEGMSFLTITLPAFCGELERALDKGCVTRDMFPGFRYHAGLPLFLGGFLELVFDRSSGLLLDDPSKEAIFFLRQILLLFKKILLPCSSERERRAYDRYIECEEEVTAWERSVTNELLARFSAVSSLLWASDLSVIDRLVYDGDLRPKHGPGATADKVVGNRKFDFKSWTHRLEDYFPSSDYIVPNWGFCDGLDSVDFFEPGSELPVRVITVPKTLKTPRIIAIEPTCMQYAQQALMEVLVNRLEKSDILQDSIGFTDQVPNQDLARSGSITGSLATIDLSEASDRVSNLLVKRMTYPFKHLAGALQACRSLRADVPGHGIRTLSKYASMGSATCFPIEAMVFLTLVCMGYEKSLSRSLSRKDLLVFLGRVRVYGDDIIVPVDCVRQVVETLEDFGLKVNSGKSFWTGKFRESCGKDFYDGEDVSVTYCRRMLPMRPGNASEMSSAVSLRNQFYKAGLWRATEFLDKHLRRLAPLPTVLETSPVLGRHSFLGYETQKMCGLLHRPLVRGMVQRPKPRKSPLDGSGALLKFFLKRGFDPFFDVKHLERYGRPESVDIKIRWASAV